MQQRPASEANSHSASQEISRLLWNPDPNYAQSSVFSHPQYIFFPQSDGPNFTAIQTTDNYSSTYSNL